MYAESIFSIFAQQNLSHSTLSQDQKKTQISKIKKQNLKMAKSSYSTLVFFFLKKKIKKVLTKDP
jgi:superfamily I DNA and RNA helicase